MYEYHSLLCFGAHIARFLVKKYWTYSLRRIQLGSRIEEYFTRTSTLLWPTPLFCFIGIFVYYAFALSFYTMYCTLYSYLYYNNV